MLFNPTTQILCYISLSTSFSPRKIFWLPTYSPKQNLIDILWKLIKYEWIEFDTYENWQSLLRKVN
ncbi:transposase [Trichodesmium erythraeum]|nr:transposase [Trichodesmium erythraeum GBRTRLIN201]